jgi:N-acetylmuramoyl-L-alanine amidase
LKNKASIGRSLRAGRYACLLAALLAAVPASARSHHGEAWARQRFASAEKMREALNGRPPADRTRRDYQRVINTYRSVYYGAPSSSKADPSAVAVAEVQVEMGRHFEDEKILKAAIAQYRFLRREYPGSKYRFDALFTIGEIYKEDLGDTANARAAFEEFLQRYPHNRLAEDAQNAIAELAREDKRETATARSGTSEGRRSVGNRTADPSDEEEAAAEEKPAEERTKSSPDSPRSTKTPRVTGIRHWSTPDSTRVAIDLESDVKFASERIFHPDRIFFDLRGTRLSSTLVGKSFDVDDGFLKKIRVAQFQPGRTRIVLEVKDLSDYEAFLVPNPYRLIIDVHGKHAKGKLPKAPAGGSSETETTSDTSLEKPKLSMEMKSDLLAMAGKAPVTSMDVGDDTKIADRIPSTTRGHANAETKSSAPVKKVVDADDDDDTSGRLSTGKAELRAPRSLKASRERARNKASDDSHETGDSDAETLATKVSATRHTVVSRSRRKAASDDTDALGEFETREAQPTATGDRSLIRALGLKIGKIVIDPGHGGHDTGTIGPNGLEEKDLVLEVGRRLGKLLRARLGAEVVYTRSDDTFIPLETRTAIANQERADLFISIHANSSRDPDARGVETYYLNFTSSPEALEVAARENAVSEKSIYELQDLVKKIALKEKIEESREFAADVQHSLHSGLAVKSPAIRDRGVKKAPFIVLIGANMPSILAEISFVSNPADERRLESSDYRQKIAESLYRGIAKYANGLSGVKVASKMDKAGGAQ